ncbi:hypothetical protein WJX75_002333 [Coccomyxa subellipsoidea]|uniref:FANCI solenoid 4 domain-containing protein n=1 Tax=Coccomyxa subellipsoidea TaxID=248742 RepID=A0ABR2YCE8_9CHLO
MKGAHSLDNGLASVINEIVQTGWQPKDTARVVSVLRDISRLGKPEKVLLMRRTVLLDIEITVKLVMQSKAWINNLKAQGSMTPFSIAVMFTLASVPRLQQTAWDILKGTVHKALQESEHRQMSRWMSALPSLPQTDAASVQACIIRALENCAMGWTIIVQPALTLAVELLDGAAKKNGGFSASLLGTTNTATAAAGAAHMGIQLSCLKALVDLVPFLELNVALGLMLAIWPLCSEQRAVKEQLIMCLRKAMFRTDIGARLLAVRGFLFIVLQELQAPDAMHSDDHGASSSQVSLSQCDSLSAAGSGASLLQELTGFLRRSLTHQAPVREALYLGMQEVVNADPLVHDALVELLLPRLCHYFESDQSLPPIVLDRCASLQKGEARLNEPFGLMLLAVRAAILAGQPEMKCAKALKNIFSNIGSRLVNSNLEDWGLDSSTDLSAGTAEGLLNHAMAGSLLGSVEVYMEDIVAGAVFGGVRMDEAGEQLTSLFSFHQRLSQLAAAQGKKKGQAAPQAKGKKRVRTCTESSVNVPAVVPIRDRQPVFSASCLFHFLHMVSEDGCLADPESSLLYLSSCKGQLPLLAIIAGTGGAEECKTLHALIGGNDWHMMGAQLLKTCQMVVLASTKNSSRNAGGKRKEHDAADDLPLLAVKSIAALLHLCPNACSLQKVMASLPPALASGSTSDDPVLRDIDSHLHHLQQLLLRLVENSYFKEVEIFCGALGHLANILPQQTTARFSDWAVECCKHEDAEEMQPRAMKALIGLLLHSAGGIDLKAAHLVADCVVTELGTEDHSQPSAALPAINKDTVSSAALALLAYLESNLQDLEWLLSTMKNSQELEEAVFKRQHGVIVLIAKLLDVSSAGTLSTNLLRLVLLSYRVLTAAAKLHIVGKGKTRPAPCQPFQDMVTLVLKQVTPAVYEFVASVQQQPQENGPEGSTEAAGSLKNEERIIPDIIFNLEDFEKHLIQITCYGHLNLMRFAKRSTNRDWRTVTRPRSFSEENQAGTANAGA